MPTSAQNAKAMRLSSLSPGAETWLRRIRLHHLEVLLVIARHGSLTAAAGALDITQPAVLQWPADIESAIGEKLFIRGQRLKPSPFAQPVLAHAERVLNDARRLGDEVSTILAGGVDRFRIGTTLVVNALSVMSSLAAAHFERQGVLRRLPLTLAHGIGDVGLVWREPKPGAVLAIVLSCFARCNRIMNPGV